MGVILGICLRQREEPWSLREKVENHFNFPKLKFNNKLNCKSVKSQAIEELLIFVVNTSNFLKMSCKVV